MWGARWLGTEQRCWGWGAMLGANRGAGTLLVNAVVAGGSQNSWMGLAPSSHPCFLQEARVLQGTGVL